MNHPSHDLLAAFDRGNLSEEDAAEIAAHLAVCPDCQRKVEEEPDDSLLSLVRRIVAGGQGPTNSVAAEGPVETWVPEELVNHPRYRLLNWLGAGGMGVVFRAEHRLMGRQVALKVLGRRFTPEPSAVERFRREVKAAARLCHPNIVQAYDADQAGDRHFLVMELVEGVNLDRLVAERGPLSVGAACDYVRQAALGLQHAADCGMVHRDIKPQNLMLTGEGRIKILDFGLAQCLRPEERDGSLTQQGQVLGTPDYLAPEQISDAHAADGRADVYSLGCTLYFLLTGQPPFPDGPPVGKMAAHLELEPKAVAEVRREVPDSVGRVVARMMAKRPGDRYQSMKEVVEALAGLSAGGRRTNRFRVALLVAVVASVVIAVLTVASWPRNTGERATEPETRPHAELPPPVEVNSIGMRMGYVPAGEFLMGSPESERDHDDQEWQHKVRISRAFYMSIFEVTQEQFQSIMGYNPARFPAKKGGGPDFPVEPVTWHEAQLFCAKLSQMPNERKANRIYRLPTEAEWEYACRAGTTTTFHYGSSLSGLQARINGDFPYQAAKTRFENFPKKVGSYEPNAWGLHDMHGNVWEWCADTYDAGYFKVAPLEDPVNSAKGAERVIRGGSWNWQAAGCRSAARMHYPPDTGHVGSGFRVVFTVLDVKTKETGRRLPVEKVQNGAFSNTQLSTQPSTTMPTGQGRMEPVTFSPFL